MPSPRTVAIVTLGCGRNEVDSEELAGRLSADGWTVLDEPADASAVLVNTCGFVEAAKKDSIDTLLAVADATGAPRESRDAPAVVAVGCLAERYGDELAGALPEARAVLGFDSYPQIAARLDDVLAGRPLLAHRPRDRRRLPPVRAVPRAPQAPSAAPGAASGGDVRPPYRAPLRRRLTSGPVAPLKLASGCDRRCAFCAIPAFRGRFVSRPPDEVLADAHWLAGEGVRELILVSENSTSYGKDLGDVRALEGLLPRLAAVPGIARVRVSYLQPAELRPSLIEVVAGTPGVAAYFDLSFQHASGRLLRRMRRFGDATQFLGLLADVRRSAPDAGARSNVIVGFPGESRDDVTQLARFLEAARLDAIGVFGYSDEDGTEAAGLPGKVARETLRRRLDRITRLAEELVAQRAEERIGSEVEVLVDSIDGDLAEGRAAHQAPEVDGVTTLPAAGLSVGDLVGARVVATDGVDLVARPSVIRTAP